MARFVRFVLAAMAGALATTGVAAQSLPEEACYDPPNEMAYRECMAGVVNQEDARLNAIWAQVMAYIESSQLPAGEGENWRSTLVQAQRDWIKFKDRDCNDVVRFEWYGGSGALGAVYKCLILTTRARADELQRRYLHQR